MKTPKSRSLRRVKVRVPGGTTKLVYKQRKPSKAKCSSCGVILKGVLRANNSKMKNTAKTKKRPERPYGGVLCGKCTRKLMIQKARGN
ncbi:MAG: 50S ribosomal protein L34e [Nanoarchaeota archaeon]|nr:50S ribosomal protein L34e [Nanoarchaeota archaeon]MCG2718484.1 50S ribosomal protein L34e [Nanoarchaeota archaeon]